MANQQYILDRNNTVPNTGASFVSYYIADTDAGKPSSGLNVGDLCWAVDTKILYIATTSTSWTTAPILGNGSDPPSAGDIGRVNRTGLTGIINPAVQLTNATSAGLYLVTGALETTTTAGGGNGMITLHLTFRGRGYTATRPAGIALDLQATTGYVPISYPVYLYSGNITFSTTLTGSIDTSQHALTLRCAYFG